METSLCFFSHVDIKRISKALDCHLRNLIYNIINENQVVHVNKMLLSEGGRLVSLVLEITNSLDTKSFVMDVDIEKAFDHINQSLLLCVFKKFGFGSEFIKSRKP